MGTLNNAFMYAEPPPVEIQRDPAALAEIVRKVKLLHELELANARILVSIPDPERRKATRLAMAEAIFTAVTNLEFAS